MKINKLSVMTVLAAGGLVACSNSAMAQDQKPDAPGRRGQMVERRMERLTEQLKLTDEQKPKVKAVLEDTQKQRQERIDTYGLQAVQLLRQAIALGLYEHRAAESLLNATQWAPLRHRTDFQELVRSLLDV